MNLFFRLIMVFLRARFSSKRIGILDSAIIKYRVWLTDQDMFLHMTNSRYLSFSDLGTINYILRTGCWNILQKKGWYPVICGQSMTVTKMLKTPQRFEVTTRLTGWNDTYVGLLHTFTRRGRVHAEVNVIARFASRDRTKVKPQDMLDAVGSNAKSPPISKVYLDLIEQIEMAGVEQNLKDKTG